MLLRQDPPFDLAYITSTHLLELLPRQILVVNDPASVEMLLKNCSSCSFRELMPPTLINPR